MTLTKTLTLSAAAAALMLAGANSGAFAAPLVDADCGNLPNTNWSWDKTGIPGSTSFSNLNPSGGSGNVFATVTVTPGGLQCNAFNPGGTPDANRSHTVPGGDPVVTDNVKICQNTGHGGSEPLFPGAPCPS